MENNNKDQVIRARVPADLKKRYMAALAGNYKSATDHITEHIVAYVKEYELEQRKKAIKK